MPQNKTDSKKEDTKNRNPVLSNHLFRGRDVLGDGLGTLRDGVLGQFTGQDQANSSLDFSGRDGGLSVVGSQLGSVGGNALEDV